MLKKIGTGLAAAGAITIGGYFLIRPRLARWGTSDEEVQRAMPGDDLIPHPTYQAIHAITINATPEAIWPWLVQMGYQRGGLYSFDTLDRLFKYLDRPSAEEILPEFQQLQVGDVLPFGRGNNMEVKALDPNQALVLAVFEPEKERFGVTLTFGLYPLDARHTRLVVRNRAQFKWTPLLAASLAWVDPTAVVMTYQMLRGIKRRAERQPLKGMPAGQAIQQPPLAAAIFTPAPDKRVPAKP